jgi:hypothetical protein
MKEMRPLIAGLVVALVLMGLFVASFVEALSAPKPHQVPFGFVGSANSQVVAQIEQNVGTALKVRTYKTTQDMTDAMDQQEIFGGLEVTEAGKTATLYVSSASGSSVAKLFEGAAPTIAKNAGVKLTVKDLKPLPKSDPNGLTVFYVALACVIYGFSGVTIALGAAPQTPLRRLLPALLVFSLCGGALVSLIAGPIIGAISFTFIPFALIAALAVFTASTITVFALQAFGTKAVPFVLLILLILGSPSSGGAAAPELLPAFFRFVGQWLPTGAATSALRNNVYFTGAQHGRPLFVLFGWLVLALGGLYLVARRRSHTLEPA